MKYVFGLVLALLLSTGAMAADLATFCDTSPDHGSTKNCNAQVAIPANTCPAGTHAGTPNCAKLGQACSVNGSPGHWCQNCTVRCIPNTIVIIDGDGEPIEFEPHQQP
jgi:hypothetical protein